MPSRSRWFVGSSSSSTLGVLDAEASEDEARRLAAREVRDFLGDLVLLEEHLRQLAPHETDRLAGAELPQPVLQGVLRAAQELLVILREVAGVGLVAPGHLALVGVDVASDDLQQGRLPDAVRPDDRETVVAHHPQRHALQHLVAVVGLGDVLDLEHLLAGRPLLREAEDGGIAARALRQLLDDDPLDLLDLALRLARLGRLGLEALDEAPVVLDLLLALGDLRFLAVAVALLALEEIVVVPGVDGHSLVVDVDDVRADVVSGSGGRARRRAHSPCSPRGTSRASGSRGCRGGSSARRAATGRGSTPASAPRAPAA